MIYPEQRGDYFSKYWTASEFNAQFNILMDEEAFVAIHEEGFIRLSFLEKIGQIIKGLFGGTDYSQGYRVQAIWLKFLYYGETHGFLTEDHIERLGNRISYPYTYFDPAIEKLFNELKDNNHQLSTELETTHLNNLRDILTDYHRRRSAFLRPGFWRRLMTLPSLDAKKLPLFGDTPLQLSENALNQDPSNPHLALAYLQEAFELKNSSSEFQEKLAEHLEYLEDFYLSELEGEQKKIQWLWIKLGETAFENELTDQAELCLSRALQTDPKNVKTRLEIGKLYLAHKKYNLAEPFLAELQKSFPNNFQIQIEVGQAYWQTDKFQEAMEVYQAALNCYQKNEGQLNSYQKQIASIYNQMGVAHLKKLIPTGTGAEAINFLCSAIRIDSTVLKYQENLWESYAQEWQASNTNFIALYQQEWLNFLDIFETSVINKNKAQIISMLLECSEQQFKAHQNQKAHVGLENAFKLFRSDVDVKIKALDLAIRYNDWNPFKSRFEAWMSEHYANPYLLEKIGNAYSNSNQTEALRLYQLSLDLFDQDLSLCEDEAERKSIEQHLANIQAQIGQSHLQVKPGIFTAVPYDEAIQKLEKAASLNPDLYNSSLFDACLAAAQGEKQRTKLLRDTNKIITYLQKAFQALPQKGDYLIELIQLYLDNKRYDEAVDLYYDMKKHSWAEEIVLPSGIYSKLGEKLLEREDREAALCCFRQAYKLDIKNQQYKQPYFQLVFNLAEKDYNEIEKNEKKDDETIKCLLEIVHNLETCWQEGFDKAEKLKPYFQKSLTQIYGSLANCYVQRCLQPRPTKKMGKQEINNHRQIHSDDIQQALNYYDKALSYDPKNAALHFDKGILLDWTNDFEGALKECELAVLHQPRNPFYHRYLAPLYFAVHLNEAKKDEHMELASKYAPVDFSKNFQIWLEERMSQIKTEHIDHHSYTQKKGWFD